MIPPDILQTSNFVSNQLYQNQSPQIVNLPYSNPNLAQSFTSTTVNLNFSHPDVHNLNITQPPPPPPPSSAEPIFSSKYYPQQITQNCSETNPQPPPCTLVNPHSTFFPNPSTTSSQNLFHQQLHLPYSFEKSSLPPSQFILSPIQHQFYQHKPTEEYENKSIFHPSYPNPLDGETIPDDPPLQPNQYPLPPHGVIFL